MTDKSSAEVHSEMKLVCADERTLRGGKFSISNEAIDWSLSFMVSCRVYQILFIFLCVILWQPSCQENTAGTGEREVVQGALSIKRLAQVLIVRMS